MKIGRRAFLQCAGGAAAGLLLSPLPWELAGGSAIWSQNWSFRPSPERGEITKTAVTCPFCPGGCGILVRLVNGKHAISIEGNPAHPVNKGGLCALASSGLQFFYAPYRIPGPLKQTRKRGDPLGFKRISWNDAATEFSGRLRRLQSEEKPHALACIAGARTSSMDDLWRRFMTAFGSPHFYTMPSRADGTRAAARIALGHDAPLAFNLERASLILSFGAELLDGWGPPCRAASLYGHIHSDAGGPSKAKLIHVGSRCSLTASKADEWIAAPPGTEPALALCMAGILLKENLYDAEFVSAKVLGLDDRTDPSGKTVQGLRSLLLSPENSPEAVSRLTLIPAETIVGLAREFASANNAVAVWGESQSPGNLRHDLAFVALNALKGNIGSGGLVGLVPTVPLGALPPIASADGKTATARNGRPFYSENGIQAFLDATANGKSGPVDLLMVHEANPAHGLSERSLYAGAAAKIGFVVSFSSYMDETAAEADLILPNHAALERWDDIVGLPETPHAFYAVCAPVLPPRQETKHTGEFIMETARTLSGNVGATLPETSYEEFLKNRVAELAASGRGTVAEKADIDLAGPMTRLTAAGANDLWKQLGSGKCWVEPAAATPWEIKTASGKIELAVPYPETPNSPAGDKMLLPGYAPLSPSGDTKEYPLLLVTYRTSSVAAGYLPTPPFMTKTIEDSVLKGSDLFVEIHPATAASLQLGNGDGAWIKTPVGEAFVRARLSHGAHPGIVYMVEGLGHTAYDEYIRNKGVDAAGLVEVQMDPLTGLGTIWATRSALRRA